MCFADGNCWTPILLDCTPDPTDFPVSGQYADANHPDGSRNITVDADGSCTIVGQDSPDDEVWTLNQQVTCNQYTGMWNMEVDFTTKGGPILPAQYLNTTGDLCFSDGNCWTAVN